MRPSNDQSSLKGFMCVASFPDFRVPVHRHGRCVTSAVEPECSGARTALIAARAIRIIEIIAVRGQQGYDGDHIDHWNEHDKAGPATLAKIMQALGHQAARGPDEERDGETFRSSEERDRRNGQ